MAEWLGGWVTRWLSGWVAEWLGGWVAGRIEPPHPPHPLPPPDRNPPYEGPTAVLNGESEDELESDEDCAEGEVSTESPSNAPLRVIRQMCQRLCKTGCSGMLLPGRVHPPLNACMFGSHASPAVRQQGCGTIWR